MPRTPAPREVPITDFIVTGLLMLSIASTEATFTDCGSAVGAGAASDAISVGFIDGESTVISMLSISGGGSVSCGVSISSSASSCWSACTISTLSSRFPEPETAVTTNSVATTRIGSRIASRGAVWRCSSTMASLYSGELRGRPRPTNILMRRRK